MVRIAPAAGHAETYRALRSAVNQDGDPPRLSYLRMPVRSDRERARPLRLPFVGHTHATRSPSFTLGTHGPSDFIKETTAGLMYQGKPCDYPALARSVSPDRA